MKEELIQKLLEWMNRSENFLSDQLPEIGNQLLTFHRIEALINVSVSALFIGLGLFFFRKGFKKGSSCYEIWPEMFMLFSSIVIGVGGLIMIGNLMSLIQSYYSPKAYLIHLLIGQSCWSR